MVEKVDDDDDDHHRTIIVINIIIDDNEIITLKQKTFQTQVYLLLRVLASNIEEEEHLSHSNNSNIEDGLENFEDATKPKHIYC